MAPLWARPTPRLLLDESPLIDGMTHTPTG